MGISRCWFSRREETRGKRKTNNIFKPFWDSYAKNVDFV